MALNNRRTQFILNAGILFLLIASVFAQPIHAFALGSTDGEAVLPNFSEFSASVQNGRADFAGGIYVPKHFALPIMQPPYGSPGFVSSEHNVLTQFRMANQYGNVGLLAHNYLAGQEFFELEVGDEMRLVHGDGTVEYFVVSEVLKYQALQPTSVYSSFRDMETEEVLSVEQMFKRVFLGDRHVTLQTCIEQEGNSSWGRLFIIAIPKAEYEKLDPLYDM